MFSSGQNKGDKALATVMSQPSLPNSESFFKKKPFSRKPAFQNLSKISEQRRLNDSNVENIISNEQLLLCQKGKEQNQTFAEQNNSCNSFLNQNNIARGKVFYSPKPIMRRTWDNLSQAVDKNIQKYEKIQSKAIIERIGKFSTLSQRTFQKPNKLQKDAQQSTKPIIKYRTTSTILFAENNDKNAKKMKQFIEDKSEVSVANSYSCKSMKSLAIQCYYCKNNKKIADIINQRYCKLQKENNQRKTDIINLRKKCEELKLQIDQLNIENQELKKQLKVEQGMFNKQKQELFLKMQDQKQQLLKLKQASKYNQIEKSMLLRVKEEHRALAKSNLQLKNKNEVMKKTLIASTLSKGKVGNFYKNKGQIVNNCNTDKKVEIKKEKESKCQLDTPSIYFDHQDDNISLDLSQFSIEYL